MKAASIFLVVAFVAAIPVVAQTTPQVGDVVVGTCDGIQIETNFNEIDIYTPQGQWVNAFDGSEGTTCRTDMTFDATGNIYSITRFFGVNTGDVGAFDNLGNEIGGFSQTFSYPRSILHDQPGNFYLVGSLFSQDGIHVVKVDSSGNAVEYSVAGGAGWITLASDQHMIIYSSWWTGDVKSFDVENQTPGPDLIVGANAESVRIMPDNSLLVDSSGVVTRWAAPCQSCYPYKQVFSYTLPASADSLALDPDGVSFWTIHASYDDVNQEGNANVYRINVKTGQLIATLALRTLPYGRYYWGSIGIYGDGMNSTASSPAALKFKGQLEGTTSAAKSVSIKNTGKVEMIVSSTSLTGDFSISQNRCGNGIRPGSHCNIYIRFQPTQLGNRSGTLNVYDNANNSPQSISLSGNGLTASSVTLASSPNPSVFGESVTFTSQVTSNAPNAPTGTVTVKDGGQKIGAAMLNAGVAVITTSKLPVGTLSITASYSGDAENTKSTSTPILQVVNPAN